MTILLVVVLVLVLVGFGAVGIFLSRFASAAKAPATTPTPRAADAATPTAGSTGAPTEILAAVHTELEAGRRDAEEIRRLAAQDLESARREAEEVRRLAAGDRNRAAEDAAVARERAAAEATAIRERADADAAARVTRAQDEAREAARAAAQAAKADAEAGLTAMRVELDGRDQRVVQREQRLEERTTKLDEQARRLEDREAELAQRDVEIGRRKAELQDVEEDRRLTLERVAGLTAQEAKGELVRTVEQQAKRDAAVLVRDIESEAREQGEERARKIVTLAIQRVASEQTTESVVSVLHLPGDEMKGRIIGREGRNIRSFESITGVNVIIDDTPEAVLLSCFDPVRREVGRLTLEALVLDGRIHPHRIEEQYERARHEVEALCVRAGEDALVQVGITEMHDELIALLGRLRYRTSYGQNVLKHLVETAHLAGVMAYELRLPAPLVKRGALLHDLGKALTHEVEGSHALIGAEIARRYGEDEEVVHAIEAHHNEVEPRTIGAVLTQAADQVSGGRPGARRESLESYVKRLERIEQIAAEKPGVEKVFAMQAGREIRVMVEPDQVDDIGAQVLARDVAKQIEDELTYPGVIRVTVVRETRSTETAR